MDEKAVRAGLHVGGRGPSLYLNDQNGHGRVGLAIHEDRPVLQISDENGKGRAVMGVTRTVTSSMHATR